MTGLESFLRMNGETLLYVVFFGGLILFGASTAFLLAVTRSWFSHLEETDS